MKIIGRKREQKILEGCLRSGRPEFIAVYGRRRVGKTYLVREYFNNNFAFYTSGASDLNMKGQLRLFYESLLKYGWKEKKIPKDWFEAFRMLQKLLESSVAHRDPATGRLVVFLDELPWMDTRRSNFKSALDFFWNTWGSAREDLALIVCGSATSWIIDNLLESTGGLYKRVTRQIRLNPFTLYECEQLFATNEIALTRQQIIQSYMVFGGIPYYLNYFDRRLSLAQNIDVICFQDNGPLKYEFSNLYASLFRNSKKHMSIIKKLASLNRGLTRTELTCQQDISDGEGLTDALSELEQCGFIRKYHDVTKNNTAWRYQVIDPFTLFYLRFLEPGKILSWIAHVGTPAFYSWCGHAFELVCLIHIPQLKEALGISGVETEEYSWCNNKSQGAQIDLVIDRKDGVANLCEMKFSAQPYQIDAAYEKQLLAKIEAFRTQTGSKKALHLTLVSASGLIRNARANCVISEIDGDDLFAP
ncbi:MAG: ATP-binding protein [Succinivibrio sp.]|nr:ATP-binding protein [Succinivibrio sp.]